MFSRQLRVTILSIQAFFPSISDSLKKSFLYRFLCGMANPQQPTGLTSLNSCAVRVKWLSDLNGSWGLRRQQPCRVKRYRSPSAVLAAATALQASYQREQALLQISCWHGNQVTKPNSFTCKISLGASSMGKVNQTELTNENLDFYIPRALPVLQTGRIC